jgi:cell wall-associated NlpC family hydrolase
VIDGRKRIATALASLCITALSGSVLVAAPTYAEPDIGTVQTRVDTLYHQAEQASERYNNARLEMQQAQTRLSALRADLARQQKKVDTVRAEVASAVVSQYQGQTLSATTQVLLSDDPDAFLDQLTTVSEYNDQQTQIMADFAVQAKQLDMRRAAAKRELDRIATTKKKLGQVKTEIDQKAGEAKALLGRLRAEAAARARAKAAAEARAKAAAEAQAAAEARQRDAVQPSRSVGRPAAPASAPTGASPSTNVPAASGRASAAVQYALAQVGDAYVYGAAGPSAFDCSGLMMAAWAQAGVGLPHSSSAQMGSGTPVSQSQLQPGDLVFYYSPVSHVGMYIGNGQIVHAANPSSGVTTAPVNSMPYSGAVRPG